MMPIWISRTYSPVPERDSEANVPRFHGVPRQVGKQQNIARLTLRDTGTLRLIPMVVLNHRQNP